MPRSGGLLALSFLFGSHLSDLVNGLIAIALIAVGGLGLMHKGVGADDDARDAPRQCREPRQLAVRAGAGRAAGRAARDIVPAQQRPGGSKTGDADLPRRRRRRGTGALLCLAEAAGLSRRSKRGRRLIDTIGWTAVLPQDAGLAGRGVRAGRRRQRGRRARDAGPAARHALRGGSVLQPRHGGAERGDGQRLRGLPGDDGRHRPALDRRTASAAIRS